MVKVKTGEGVVNSKRRQKYTGVRPKDTGEGRITESKSKMQRRRCSVDYNRRQKQGLGRG